MEIGWKSWEGKKVYIILKNRRKYTGKIVKVNNTSEEVWIYLLDRFHKLISFTHNEVELIQEEEK